MNAAPRSMRIVRELKEFQDNQSDNCHVYQINEDINHLKGWVIGPDDTPYKGGKFYLDIVLPNDYPFKPPHMKFQTKIWHPNISSQSGAICLDILKNEWTPALSLRTTLLSIIVLMQVPQPDDPQDAVVAGEYKQDKNKFEQTARQWTEQYAMQDPYAEQLKTLIEMGYPEVVSKQVLERTGGNLEETINIIIKMEEQP